MPEKKTFKHIVCACRMPASMIHFVCDASGIPLHAILESPGKKLTLHLAIIASPCVSGKVAGAEEGIFYYSVACLLLLSPLSSTTLYLVFCYYTCHSPIPDAETPGKNSYQITRASNPYRPVGMVHVD